jgi:integrase
VTEHTTVGPRRARRRSPGEGSVYQDRPDRWRAAVAWVDSTGVLRRRTVTGRTQAEARRRLDELRRQRALGTLAPSGTGTVGEYLEAWIERYRPQVRLSGWRTAEMHVRVYLIPSLGKIPLAKLGAADVERAMAAWLATGRPERPAKRGRGRQNAGGVSPLTVRHIRSTLRRALSDAVRDGLAGRNAAAEARPPRVPHRPITYLARRDVRRLLDATMEEEYGPLYAVLATTGVRIGEALGLAWADVEGGVLRVRRALARQLGNEWALSETKTAKSRRAIPLPARARVALDVQGTRQRFARAAAGSAWQDTDGLVFTDPIGRSLRPEAVSREFRTALARAGVPRVRLHDLRHSAATSLLEVGVPIAVISEWLGHASIGITASTYAAVVPELLTEAAEAMDRALAEDAS